MAIKECGFFCPMHFMARAPFGLAHKIEALAPGKITGRLPRALALVVDRFDPSVRGLPLRLAIAAVMPPTADTRALRDLLAEALPTAKLFVDPRGRDQLFSLGLGCDPRELFTASSRATGLQELGGLRIEFGPLANTVAPASPRAAALLDRIGPLRSRVDLSGRALSGEVLIDLKGAAPLAFEPFDGNCPAWESPGAAAAATPGARCMHKMTRAMIKGFSALSYVDPGQRSVILARLAEELDPLLRCAIAEQDTRAAAASTQSALTLWVAGRLEEEMREQQEIALLDRVCKQGRQDVCRKLAAVKAQAPVHLPEITSECACLPSGGRSIVRIPAEQQGQTESASGNAPDLGGKCPALAIDVGVPFSRLVQIVGESVKGCSEVNLLVRRAGRVELVPIMPAHHRTNEVAKPDRPVQLADLVNSKDFIGSQPIVIRQNGSRIELSTAGQSMSFVAARECPAETSCQNLKDLHAKLAELFEHTGRLDTIYFDAGPDTTTGQLAPCLAAAACEPCRGDYPGRRARVVIGPVPQEVLDAANKGPLTISPGKSEVTGSLSKEIIRRVIRRNINAVRYCYEKELIKNPALSGKLIVNFIIAADGRVQQARIDSSTIGNKQVEKCIIYAVRRFKFPKPQGGGVVRVNYPFIFKSGN